MLGAIKTLGIFIITSIMLVLIPVSNTEVAASPFQAPDIEIDEKTGKFLNESSLEQDAKNMTAIVTNSTAPLYEVGVTIITIIFIVAVLVMALAIIFKNGQWTKWSSGAMTMSFLVILLLRGVPIILLTTEIYGVNMFFTDLLNFTSGIGIYIAIGMVLVGSLFRYFYVLIKHPDYFRWSKRLFVGSFIIATLSITMPMVFLGI